jgi:8-oxo-dGTP pyrophosphatase MutT (NUDIX family)
MELGERIDQTAVNEVLEETGLEVRVRRLIGLYSGERYRFTYPNGDQIKLMSALFDCRIVAGKLRPDKIEVLETRFFLPDSLPPLPPSYSQRVLDGLSGGEAAVFD